MKKSVMVLAVVCMLGWTALPHLQASAFDKKTFVTFNQSTEIPGMVLPPGEYVMKRADRSLPDVVRFTNARENHVYATVFALPTYRSVPTDKVVIVTEERRSGSPEAIKKWFYPGDTVGAEFVYPKSSSTLMAMNMTPATTFSEPTPAPVTPAPAITQASPPVSDETQSQPEPAAPTEVAQNSMPQSSAPSAAQPSQPSATVPAQPTTQKELPKTASNLPMLGLGGLLCIFGGFSLRKLSRQVS